MSALLKQHYTLEEYFELELSTLERFEYYDGAVISLSGVSEQHDQIEVNYLTALRTKLRGKPCRIFAANMRIKVPSLPPYRYGDGSALCGQPVFEKIGGVDTIVNPQIIIEVLSPSTSKRDKGFKFKHYKSIESFSEYLLIEQDVALVTHYIKHNERFWLQTEYDQLSDIVNLTTLDCELTLAEIYEDVELADPNTLTAAPLD